MRLQVVEDVNNPEIQENEKKFKEDIEKIWKCNLERLPIVYSFDYAVVPHSKNIKAWIELKNRNFYSYTFKDSLINLSKWIKGNELQDNTGLPSILALRYYDKDLYYKFNKNDNIIIKWGARTKKTRDWQDIGPAVHIPMELFKELK